MLNYLKYVTPEEVLENCKDEMSEMYDCLDEIFDLSEELRKKSKILDKRATAFSRGIQKIIFERMNEDDKLEYMTRVSDLELEFVNSLFSSVGLVRNTEDYSKGDNKDI